MSHILKNLLIALIAIVLLGGVYIFMTKDSGVSSNSMMAEADITARTNQILMDTKKIDGYKLDTSIFDDARFKALKDYHVNISDVKSGRSNPFAPVQ